MVVCCWSRLECSGLWCSTLHIGVFPQRTPIVSSPSYKYTLLYVFSSMRVRYGLLVSVAVDGIGRNLLFIITLNIKCVSILFDYSTSPHGLEQSLMKHQWALQNNSNASDTNINKKGARCVY